MYMYMYTYMYAFNIIVYDTGFISESQLASICVYISLLRCYHSPYVCVCVYVCVCTFAGSCVIWQIYPTYMYIIIQYSQPTFIKRKHSYMIVYVCTMYENIRPPPTPTSVYVRHVRILLWWAQLRSKGDHMIHTCTCTCNDDVICNDSYSDIVGLSVSILHEQLKWKVNTGIEKLTTVMVIVWVTKRESFRIKWMYTHTHTCTHTLTDTYTRTHTHTHTLA